MNFSSFFKCSTRTLCILSSVATLSLTSPAAFAEGPFANKLISRAMDLIGVKYRFGGTSPTTGLDCSGYVQYVFKNAVGIDLPRVAAAQSKVGEKVNNIDDIKVGDMVFFNTRGAAASHVGIYAGNDMFIHSPRSGSTVRLDSMKNSYWKARYTGARRVSSPNNNTPSSM